MKSASIVCHNKLLNLIGICNTYSTVGSVLTEDELIVSFASTNGWEFLGSPKEFYTIAKNRYNMKLPNVELNVDDYDYSKNIYLYNEFLSWYSSFPTDTL